MNSCAAKAAPTEKCKLLFCAYEGCQDRDDFLERLSIILPETNTSCYTWAFLDTGHVLGHFGKSVKKARNEYLVFVRASVSQGQKPELVGGGLIRSFFWGGVEGGKGARIEQAGSY
ncbi:MAG: hypothetical protein B6240_05500 [Desulfobacteraceae bacterium 4572_87]|nr:MAG: hypothetical protein B6240_05500 [Desulfobacteraceae bacterium 4572_87]